jgi:hypothetical protein
MPTEPSGEEPGVPRWRMKFVNWRIIFISLGLVLLGALIFCGGCLTLLIPLR